MIWLLAPSQAEEKVNPVGTWQFEIETGMGAALTPSIAISKDGDKLVGVYQSPRGEIKANNVKLQGNQLSFDIDGDNGGLNFSVSYKGTINGDAISGSMNYKFGTQAGAMKFKGKRTATKPTNPMNNPVVSQERMVQYKPEELEPELVAILGRTISDFTLKDFRGKTHSLSDFKDSKAVVVYFLGTECPLAKLYGPRLQRLAAELESKNVAFLGISANVQDSITELAAHARIHEITFPILKDLGNKIADQFGATRTPQVFLLDEHRKVRYLGRVDAQFTFGSGVGLARPQDQRNDLAIAIDELLTGKKIRVPVTDPKGCIIGRVREVTTNSLVTYSNQISRIVQNRCLECHREGKIAPFAMTDYDEVAGWGEMIAEVVQEQRMPPWHADPRYGDFSNANRLTDKEKELIYTWVENGCPEGDTKNLPPKKEFAEGWFLPRTPDKVIYIADKPVKIKKEGVESYRHYVVDPGFTEDKWVSMAECMPGNAAVVHHIIVYVRPPKRLERSEDPDTRDMEFLVGFAPGTRPLAGPKGWAKRIPAGSRLVFQMHYTPIGTAQMDRSSVGLIFVDKKEVTHQLVTTNTINHQFRIPANHPNYKVESRKTIRRDAVMFSLFPHMHMRGKSFRYELTHPDGRHEILLDIPTYDFNWQYSYIFRKPFKLAKGSQLHCTAVFDNSDQNLANPDPSKPVQWGEQTWEEMMIGWYDIGYPIKVADIIKQKNGDSNESDAKKEKPKRGTGE